MPDPLFPYKFQKLYLMILAATAIAVTAMLLSGKDTVAIWPLAILAAPLGLVLLAALSMMSFEWWPTGFEWILPITLCGLLMLLGTVQVWLLGQLLHRLKRSTEG
ncbi:hypothetical protein [Sphaerisporangium fuscum]|uniref:hypothetical protein n=1 Tax=Sphaerisporangium fuscum TaxID=2835868 RepID=UPI001BDCDA7D|nr:hypothetical protein [Sphaerisporangium fuscum]